MPRKHGANLRPPRIGAPLPLRVRHHAARLHANFIGWIRKPNRVAVRFRHPPPVEPRQAWRLGQQMAWLLQDLSDTKQFPATAHFFAEVFDANFGSPFSEDCPENILPD